MRDIILNDNIFQVGINDRITDLFEGLWPIKNSGISYNSYIIKDTSPVLIDLVKGFKTDEFFDYVSSIVDLKAIKYVIVNHMEPDHTGVLHTLRMINPGFQIICTAKAVAMLKEYYDINDNIRVVHDGDTIDTGTHTLQFYQIPFVHWPETMVTYDVNSKTIFSCDAFGGYGALQGAYFDDDYPDISFYEKEALRYYANVIAKFATPVRNAIKKLQILNIEMVAPSHGLIWRKSPARIIDLYNKWADCSINGGERGVTLLYGSMYGNTEAMMNVVAQGISDRGIIPQIFDVARTHSSYILPSLLVNKGVVIGAPTYEVSLFPYMQEILKKAALKNIKHKKAVYFGSYGWSRGGYKKVQEICAELGWEVLEGLEFAGKVTDKLFSEGFELGKRFATLL
ncbi:MAG: FprA family A-type flavoprotein [Fibrobacter sp.]|nr:FprA family A-type flavoprotein [Fibrobacter sp.]